MLSISTKTQYGLLALLELSDSYGKNLVQLNDIVSRRRVPRNYLVQILNRLQKGDIVKSSRGQRGGYELGHHPDNITLGQIVEMLEGSIKLHNNKICASLDEVLDKIELSVKELMNISLSQLLERERALESQIIFSI